MDFTSISVPAWAGSNEAQAWFYGLAAAAMVRVFRAGLRWLKRTESGVSSD